jgi:hypothetical protein
MFVLVIAVAALLGFAALICLLLFARFAESRHTSRLPVAPEPLFSGLSYDQAFEDHYELIWQVQVPGLELIRTSGEAGLPVHTLRPWFERTLRSYPDLFEGHTFEEWLEFLQRSRVGRFHNDRVRLTTIGCELLDHCRMAG